MSTKLSLAEKEDLRSLCYRIYAGDISAYDEIGRILSPGYVARVEPFSISWSEMEGDWEVAMDDDEEEEGYEEESLSYEYEEYFTHTIEEEYW